MKISQKETMFLFFLTLLQVLYNYKQMFTRKVVEFG